MRTEDRVCLHDPLAGLRKREAPAARRGESDVFSTLDDFGYIILSAEDFDLFVKELDKPGQADPALARVLRRRPPWESEGD